MKRWTEVASMASARSAFTCGRVQGDFGTEVVVVNRFGAEIFSLADMIWRPGPDFPPEGLVAASVFQFSNDFFFAGGQFGGPENPVDTVWQFDVDSYEFVLREDKLQVPRFNSLPSAVVINEDFLPQC